MARIGKFHHLPAHITLDLFVRDHRFEDLSIAETGMFFLALHTAVKQHWSQTRKDGITPYHEHLLAVADGLDRMGFPVEVQVAGLLHDVFEDCGMSIEEIRRLFGQKVAVMVAGLSKDKTRPEGYCDQLFEVTKEYFETSFAKLFDLWHNVVTVYGLRSPEKQMQFLRETVGSMHLHFKRSRPLIPEAYLDDYDWLVKTIHAEARAKLDSMQE